MTRHKDNPFARTIDRLTDFLKDQQDPCGRFYRIVSEDGSELKLSAAMLQQFVSAHIKMGERIHNFNVALKGLEPL